MSGKLRETAGRAVTNVVRTCGPPHLLVFDFMSNKICLKPCKENGRIKDCVQWNSVHCWKGFRLQGGGRCSNLGLLDQQAWLNFQGTAGAPIDK